MQSNMHDAADKQLNSPFPSVIQTRGDPCVGPTEISGFMHEEKEQDLDGAAISPKTDAQTQFELLIQMCCEINNGKGYFHGRTTELVTAIKPAYSIFRHILTYPELEKQLRANDFLKDRTRQLGKNKLALLCLYCTMNPITQQQKKSCSDYTAWLFQAQHENISPETFTTWAEEITLKACLGLIRRRRAESALDQPASKVVSALSLSIRRGAKGVCGVLNGKNFPMSENTLQTIIKMIEAEQLEAEEGAIGTDKAPRSSFMETHHAQ